MKTVDENKARKVLGDEIAIGNNPTFQRKYQLNVLISEKIDSLMFKNQNNNTEIMEVIGINENSFINLMRGNMTPTLEDIAKLEMFFGERIIEVPFQVVEEKETLTKEQELTLSIFKWKTSVSTFDIGRFNIKIRIENCYVYYQGVLLFQGNKHFDMNSGKDRISGKWFHEGKWQEDIFDDIDAIKRYEEKALNTISKKEREILENYR